MKRRTIRRGLRAEWKSKLRTMSEAAKKEWNENRLRTAKSGYAKRKRERENDAPMASRTHEHARKRFVTPSARPDPRFAGWLRQFHAATITPTHREARKWSRSARRTA